MSRSYKKTPIIKDNKRTRKFFKKQANKKTKNYKEKIHNGSMYKKIFASYKIYDFIFYSTFEDYIDFRRKKFKENKKIEEFLIEWKKYYYFK